MQKTSASLLERLRGSNPQTDWVRFVHLYTPLLCHWAQKLGAAGPDVDDLTQEVFAVLLQKLPAFHYDPGQRFRGWLWTIIRNKYRERLRRKSGAQGAAVPMLEDPAQSDPLDEVIELEYRQHIMQGALQLIQNEFETPTWQAFWECTVNERPAAEVAADLGLSVASVYAAKSRVLRRLREEMQGLLD
jgi:RNA polymerase sigma-70 factor (ECF subfamily)